MRFEDAIEEIKVRFEQTGELSSSDKSFIESMYERVLSKSFSRRSCGQCYQDAFVEMYTSFKKNGIKKMGLLILKRGALLHYKNEVYTRVNMTDEIAAELLKENPKRASFFEELPDNWEELIKDDLSGKGKSEDSAEQIAAEKALIIEIAKLLLDKTTKTAIREKYTGQKVGEKDIKTRDIAAFIKEADELLKDPEKLKEFQDNIEDKAIKDE